MTLAERVGLLAGFAMLCGAALSAQSVAPATKPGVTIPDVIRLTLFGSDWQQGGDETDAVTPSPDGAHVAVLLQRGNLEHNTVDFALVVFRTADAVAGTARPDTLVAIASASNDPAIAQVRWLRDNRTVVFLGRRPGEPAQVYGIDIATHTVTARTHSATGITTYEIAPAGEPLLYQEMKGAIDTSQYASMRAHGYAITHGAWLADVVAGDFLGRKWKAEDPGPYQLLRGGRITRLPEPDSNSAYRDCHLNNFYDPALSPRGDRVLFQCHPTPVPAGWRAYSNPRFRKEVEVDHDSGGVLVLLDLTTKQTRLLDAGPITHETSWMWSPDGQSLVITNALLPLSGPDSARRARQRMTIEVPLAGGGGPISVVAPHDTLITVNWDAATNTIELAEAREAWVGYERNSARIREYYRKRGGRWSRVAVPPRPIVRLDVGPNTPPRLVVVTPGTAPRVVFDPNREYFATHRAPRVDLLHFVTRADSDAWVAGLYYPLDYAPGGGRRYPLVIQTHGFDSTRYNPNGAFTTNFVAAPLASNGIFVLQVVQQTAGDRNMGLGTPAEGPIAQRMVEAAIDTLAQRGLIDREQVALHGFSRTVYSTLFFLTHSSYPIAAADIADGVDMSYGQYIAVFDGAQGEWESTNGGPPWGPTQAKWIEHSPTFRMNRINAALRLTAITPPSVINGWEHFAAMSLQKKPVEFVYLPLGSHVLVRPWERLTSQQGAVDWYRFWLQGYEDPDSTKAEQYTRWREMRAQHDPTHASSDH